MKSVTERYQTDATFRQLVDMLYSAIDHGDFTPTEIREAAIFAQSRWENSHLRNKWIIPLRSDDQISVEDRRAR